MAPSILLHFLNCLKVIENKYHTIVAVLLLQFLPEGNFFPFLSIRFLAAPDIRGQAVCVEVVETRSLGELVLVPKAIQTNCAVAAWSVAACQMLSHKLKIKKKLNASFYETQACV
jgi:hypothetical protein